MARTMFDLIARVRELLQDDNGTRYTDDQVKKHAVDAYEQARSVRPDIFVGQYAAAMPDYLSIPDTFALPDQFFAAVSMYVAGACEMRDDEFAVDGRAMTLQQTLSKKLVSGM